MSRAFVQSKALASQLRQLRIGDKLAGVPLRSSIGSWNTNFFFLAPPRLSPFARSHLVSNDSDTHRAAQIISSLPSNRLVAAASRSHVEKSIKALVCLRHFSSAKKSSARDDGRKKSAPQQSPPPTFKIETEYEYMAHKVWVIRFCACTSIVCCMLVIANANYFWHHMIFFEPAQRLAFIVGLGMLAGGMLTLAVKWQKRYVMQVVRDKFNPGMIRISCPYFLGSKSIVVHPSEIEPASLTINELLFGLRPRKAKPQPDKESLRGRGIYGIQVKGYKMVMDASMVPKHDRDKLLALLGLLH